MKKDMTRAKRIIQNAFPFRAPCSVVGPFRSDTNSGSLADARRSCLARGNSATEPGFKANAEREPGVIVKSERDAELLLR